MLTIKQYCLALPYWARVSLFNALKESILKEKDSPERRLPKKTDANRGTVLLDAMADVLGEPVDMYSRRAKFVWARAMVGYQLTQEGFSTAEAGEQIEKEHSTISYLNSKMRFVLEHPYAYEDIIDIWKQFQTRLQYDIHEGTTHDPLQMGV